jgi:cobalt/nickel transport system permease protein
VIPSLLEPYEARRSPIHRLPAGLKCAVGIGFVVGIVLLPRQAWAAYAVSGAAVLGLAVLSRIPLARLGARLLLIEPVALGVALLSLAQPGGLAIFAATLTRSTLCLSVMVLLAATTRFTDILRVLWRIRVPALLVTVLALTHRYLFVLVEEAGRMVRARRSRCFSTSRASVWRSSAGVVAHLFVRGSERAERVYAAMCARGWKT